MNSEQFLEEIKKKGLLETPSFNTLKREVLLSGRTVEAIAFERRLVDDVKLAELKSELLNVPFRRVESTSLDKEVLKIVPEETARTYRAIPIEKQGDLLIVGMIDPDDDRAQEALKFIARKERLNLGVYAIPYSDWQSVLRLYSPYRTGVEEAVRSMNLKPIGDDRVVSLDQGATTEEGPIVRIVAETFREAVGEGASDIHIEPQQNYVRIRFRTDGDLKEVTALPPELGQPVISRVKVISSLKIDETRIPQDGRFRTTVFNRSIDFRVSTFPTPLGEKVAIRVLDPTTGLKGFDELGLMGRNLELIEEGLKKPYGMILVTGPTGSGKTTTLYALLQALNNDTVNIVSLEDPVEYFVPGINQSQVRPEIGYDFASGLRQILRQDPDVIMVGEVRDVETSGLAVHAALTGHVVLSTLHTNNALGVIPRLVDMKIEPFLISASLNLMVGQRLVLKLCPHCREKKEASPEMQKIIDKALTGLSEKIRDKYPRPYTIFSSPGCAQCRGKGNIGRIAILEVIPMTNEIESLLASSTPDLQKIATTIKAMDVMTMRQDGVLKALEGMVSIEDVLKETAEL
ncbi:MAG: type II/IV secretion system protein [Anaplasmataceae bacterium]|nr:type II/IV secretion system protein [Anaplasmataceae bacterium]